jgi:two-component system, LuxR family, response regulator FixJ
MDALVYLVDDDESMRRALTFFLRAAKFAVEGFASGQEFLANARRVEAACLVSDIRMPGMDGLELQQAINVRYPALPVILMTGHGDVSLAVRGMRAGAVDFLEKPFENEKLLASIDRAIGLGHQRMSEDKAKRAAAEARARLTKREVEVLDLMVEGDPSKVIGHKLGISARTVEVHRVRVMEKMRVKNMTELIRLYLPTSRS